MDQHVHIVHRRNSAELQYTSWWDGSGMKFEMRGMDPTCCHPKPGQLGQLGPGQLGPGEMLEPNCQD